MLAFGKWIWRLKNEEVMSQDLVTAKYVLKKGTFTHSKPTPSHSHFWSGTVWYRLKDVF
jgi:hypothetical protein